MGNDTSHGKGWWYRNDGSKIRLSLPFHSLEKCPSISGNAANSFAPTLYVQPLKEFAMRSILATVCATTLLLSCGEQMRQAQETAKVLSTVAKNAPQAKNLQAQIEQRQQERRAKGDTLPIPYEQLLTYLPTSIAGFQPSGDPEGSTISSGEFAYSNAKRTFRSDNGTELTVEIADYNSYSAGLGLVAMGVFANFSVENADERSHSFDPGLPVSGAWESYKKKSNDAEVLYILGGRFWLRVAASKQQNTDFVKSVAHQVNLRALASM